MLRMSVKNYEEFREENSQDKSIEIDVTSNELVLNREKAITDKQQALFRFRSRGNCC